MTRLKATIAQSSEDNEVVGKKAQKRLAKAAARAAAQAAHAVQASQAAQVARTAQSTGTRSEARAVARDTTSQAEDAMSRCALLCQEQRWREATLLCRDMVKKAQSEGKPEMAAGLQGALRKIESSLRRQMAAAFIVTTRDWLNKEYLLDVGE